MRDLRIKFLETIQKSGKNIALIFKLHRTQHDGQNKA